MYIFTKYFHHLQYMLMQTLYEDPYLTILHDEARQVIYTKTTPQGAELTHEQIRALILTLAGHIKAQRPRFMMANDQERGFVYDVPLQKWVADTLAEAAVSVGAQKYAVLLPTELIKALSTEQVAEEVVGAPFEIAYFDNEQAAWDWFEA
ncbi:MAG TPA: hypothetical protein DCM08_01120 [Microscillaceae bacterium]|jgi:hypothetical protein|nr:hypothetical protein [Microscillaceae bacterium]